MLTNRERSWRPFSTASSCERVFFARRRRHNFLSQKGIAFRDLLFHLPGNGSIRPVSFDPGSQTRNVFRLGVVHLKEASNLESEWNGIECGLLIGFPKRLNVHFY